MAEHKVNSEIKVEGDKVVINANLTETMTKDEFVEAYERNGSDYYMLQSKISMLKKELMDIIESEKKFDNDEKMKEFISLLKAARKVEGKERIVEELRKLEADSVIRKADLDNYKSVYDKIKKELQDKHATMSSMAK